MSEKVAATVDRQLRRLPVDPAELQEWHDGPSWTAQQHHLGIGLCVSVTYLVINTRLCARCYGLAWRLEFGAILYESRGRCTCDPVSERHAE